MNSFWWLCNPIKHPSLLKDPEELHNGYGNPEYAARIDALKVVLKNLREKYQDDDRYQNCTEHSL